MFRPSSIAALILLAAPAHPQAGAVLSRYCATCHSEKAKTAGFTIDAAGSVHPGEKAEYWEKVIRKLRSNAMPPAGAPRPDARTMNATIEALETELDRAAAVKANPGKLPLLHRLSRTEYQHTVRDLLAVDALPKELDYSMLLPADNASSGFDNLADLLFVSPSDLERYVDAAQKISALAIGDPTTPVMVNIHKISDEQWQDSRDPDLPFGTRGGLAVKSHFPLDGEYTVKVEFAGVSVQREELEIGVDGERLHLAQLGANTLVGGARVRGYRPQMKTQEFRIAAKAGPRVVGVAFIEQNQTRDEETLRPQLRGRGTRLAIASVTISGPFQAKGPGDTPSRQRIFVCRPASSAEELPCARRILSTLMQRAYRRPVTPDDLARLEPFYQTGRAEGGFERGIQSALERLLVSPQFLFRIEREAEGLAPGAAYRIGDVELASRLSYFLWSSMPDDELLNLALRNQLSDPAVLTRQTQRMLADPRSRALVTNFAEQWLFLRDLESKKPDDLVFQDFDETLRHGFRQETELFVDSVLRDNRSVLDLLTANYTFLNERIAKHYGIPNVQGSHFRRVALPADSPRGGLLGQGSLLTITSYSTRTSPVVRGKWVLENLLSAPPPPPPANIPALKTESGESGKALSMREALTRHRADAACAGCHARMDPIGFAMENFDAVGRWRDLEAGNRIDASGVLPDGTAIDGMAGLKKALLLHPEEFVTTVAEKLLTYGIGRNVQFYDRPTVRAIVRQAGADNNTFASLVSGVVRSKPFQMRTAQGGGRTK